MKTEEGIRLTTLQTNMRFGKTPSFLFPRAGVPCSGAKPAASVAPYFKGVQDKIEAHQAQIISLQASELDHKMEQQVLKVGDFSLNSKELLILLDEMAPNATMPVSNGEQINGVQVFDRVAVGILSLGIVPIVRYFRSSVKCAEVTKKIFKKSSDDNENLTRAAFATLIKEGMVVRFRNEFHSYRYFITPKGREYLAGRKAAEKENTEIETLEPEKLNQTKGFPATAQSTEPVKAETRVSLGDQDKTQVNPSLQEPVTALHPETQANLETLHNARDMGAVSHENTAENSPLAVSRNKISWLRSHMYSMFCMAGILGLPTAASIAPPIMEISNPRTTYNTGRPLTEWEKQNQRTFYAMSGVMILLFGGLMGAAALSGVQGYRELRRELQKAKSLEKTFLERIPEAEPVGRRLTQLLEARSLKLAEQFSTQIRTAYENKPEIREVLDQTFGSKEALPTAKDISLLFRYYAYQLVVAEQRVPNGEALKPISELAFQTQVYTLLKIGLDRGEVYEFMKKQEGRPFNQEMKEGIRAHLELVEDRVKEEIAHADGLLRRDIEIENHLVLARKALTRAVISTTNRRERVEDIEGIITEFKKYRERIQKALAEPSDTGLTVDLDLLREDSFEETLVRLRAALETEKHQEAVDASLDQALQSLKDENRALEASLQAKQKTQEKT